MENPELLNLHKSLSVQSLIFAHTRAMSTICQVYYLIVGGVFYKNVGILLRGCLNVKNYWELLTGDDGVGFRGLSIHIFAMKFF